MIANGYRIKSAFEFILFICTILATLGVLFLEVAMLLYEEKLINKLDQKICLYKNLTNNYKIILVQKQNQIKVLKKLNAQKQ